MKTFEYKGYDSSGRSWRGLIEALSVKDARRQLHEQGILAENLVQTGRHVRFPSEVRATVYRELGALLRAGLPMVRALEIIIRSPETGAVRSLLAAVKDRLQEGVGLADALGEASRSITPFERAIIESAEQSATVDVMLERLASYLEESNALRQRIQGALIYPAMVLCVGICVAVVMLGLLLPRAREILSQTETQLPLVTVIVTRAGWAAGYVGIPALIAAVVAAAVVRVRMRHSAATRIAWARRVFDVPVLGRGTSLLCNLRFARTMAILLEGGVSLIDAMLLGGRATGNAWVAERVRMEAESVRNGGRLSDAIRNVPPLAAVLPGWIEVGEASGGLASLLESAGERFQSQWDRFVQRALGLIEPLLILLIGGFVLLVTLSVLLPVLSLSRAAGV